LGRCDPCMVNVCLQNKFGVNRSRNCWDTPVYVFPRCRRSAILNLFYHSFGRFPAFLSMGLFFCCWWRSDATEILWFYNFADWAVKCLFGPILDSFYRILTPKLRCQWSDPKGMQLPGDTRFEILCVKIGSEMPSVALFKKHYVKNLLAEHWMVILHPYREKPPVIRLLPNVGCVFPSRT